MSAYDAIYRRSIDHPQEFWAEAAAAIDWDTNWSRVLDDSDAPFYRWFAGGRLNTGHNALDRHVAGGRADQAAVIYDSPLTDTGLATFATANITAENLLTRAQVATGDLVMIPGASGGVGSPAGGT